MGHDGEEITAAGDAGTSVIAHRQHFGGLRCAYPPYGCHIGQKRTVGHVLVIYAAVSYPLWFVIGAFLLLDYTLLIYPTDTALVKKNGGPFGGLRFAYPPFYEVAIVNP
jgi:hypothetical protein